MFIQHNNAAFNVWRNWNLHNQNAAKSMQRIASGQRINSAADDAAGLSIAQKMKAQLRMLQSEQRSVDDRISMSDTADSILGQTQQMLSRMVELSTKAMSGTYTDMDRKNLDKEYQQLLGEIDRIGVSMSYRTESLFQNTGGAGSSSDSQAVTEFSGNRLDQYLTGLNQFLDQVSLAVRNKDEEAARSLGIDLSDHLTDSERLRKAVAEFSTQNGESLLSSQTGSGTGQNAAFTISVSGDNVTIKMNGPSSDSLGLAGSSLLSRDSAASALDQVRSALDSVSSQRGNLGALSNQLQHTKNRLAQMESDLTESLSRILDADIAKEMMEYTRSQMLSQVSSFLMAHAKREPEQVLALIKSL